MRKGIFIWKVPQVKGGDPDQIAELLKSANISRVDVKVAEGNQPYKVPRWNHPTWGLNVKPEWVQALKAHDIEVWGWGFNYGFDPSGEGRVAAEQVEALSLDGYGFDLESKFESWPDARARANTVGSTFRSASVRRVPAALITWPLWNSPWSGGQWHNPAMARGLMPHCDIGMPMCYWSNGNALVWLSHSISQWRQLVTSDKPIIPAGRAYSGEGLGQINPAEVTAFGQGVRTAGLKGESWWELRIALTNPAVWAAISALPNFGEEPPPPPPPGPVTIKVTVPRGTVVQIEEV